MQDFDLKILAEKGLYVIRKAKNHFKNMGMLWSMGKDSTVSLALVRRAFFGKVPFPVIHIDNGIDFPETYALREKLTKEWNLNMIVAKSIIHQDKISGIDCCGANKTEALVETIKDLGLDALIVSIRRDEHGIRAKEQYFSPRDVNFKWDYKNMPPEIGDYISDFEGSDHVRIHPILDWREIDIWRYIKENNLPVNPLYFARNGKRFRSLGCTKCTVAVPSTASNVDEIIRELESTDQSERGGRAQDKEKEYVMQQLRAMGYM